MLKQSASRHEQPLLLSAFGSGRSAVNPIG